MEQTPRFSICFVALKAYPILVDRQDLGLFGGAEIQQVRVGRELTERGFSVSFVTFDVGQPDAVVHKGIACYKTYRVDDGWPIVRFVHPRWTRLWAALSRADADIYYQRGAACETGQVALWCRRHDRPFVFASASDTNCVPGLPDLVSRRERWLYRYGLRSASRVIAQTCAQQDLLRRNFGVEPVLIRSCLEIVTPGRPRTGVLSEPPRILWVGRVSPKKRIEWLFDLAELCPNLLFDVVGDDAGNEAARYKRQTAGLTNLFFHGRVPPSGMPRFYDRADVLVCTSVVEGYPNTFLEAWARGLPVVSTVDPDGVLARQGVGLHAPTVPEMKAALQRLLHNTHEYHAISQKGRDFVSREHALEQVIDAYEHLLTGVWRSEHQPGWTSAISVSGSSVAKHSDDIRDGA